MPDIKPPGGLDFSRAQESWDEWSRRFERYRSASGLSEKAAQRQVDTLFYIMGEEAEKIFSQLTVRAAAADEDADGTLYKRTLEAFEGYFNPRSNKLHYCIVFNNRTQTEGESNEEFIRNVHELSLKCNFEANRDDMIRMRLLAGMKDKALSRELQLDAEVTLDAVKTKMRAKEIISKHQREEIDGASGTSSSATVNKVAQSRRSTGRGWGLPRASNDRDEDPTGTKSRVRGMWGEVDGKGRGKGKADITNCNYCGRNHPYGQCPAHGKRCNKCHIFNHFSAVCKTNSQSKSGSRMNAACAKADTDSSSDDDGDAFCVYSVNDSEWRTDLFLSDTLVSVKIDTGAEVNVIPKSVMKQIGQREATRSKVSLKGFTGHEIPVIGKTSLRVCRPDSSFATESLFYVVDDDNLASSITLLGLQTVRELGLVSTTVSEVSDVSESVVKVIDEYQDVFSGLGTYKKQVSLELRSGAVPKAVPPRVVPHRKRQGLKSELDSLVSQGVIVADDSPSEWLTPIVLVAKPDGSTRICLDPQYLNTQLIRAQCHIPTMTEIFADVSGSKYFSCLDAKQGFHQVVLEEESSRLFCFVTPFGKYRYVRLPMGTCNSPEIFHQIMTETLRDIPGVAVYIDDVLVHASSVTEHNRRLKLVLDRLREAGLTMNKKKSVFLKESVDFLGHKLTGTGVQPQRSKVEAVQNMVIPADKEAVQRYLGFITYLSKFIPRLSELTHPLREVCKRGREFIWEAPQMKAFEDIREIVTQSPELALYEGDSPVVLQSDASAHSLGAVLIQNERPVEFAAKSLSDTQQRYSQIEKEFLAVVFACQRFRYYTVGRSEVVVETDHMPLIGLMKKDISQLTPRLAKMRFSMLNYPNICLVYKPGKQLVLADTLSRSCPPGHDVSGESASNDPMPTVCTMVFGSPEAHGKYQLQSRNDEELPVVARYIQEGWPTSRKRCAARALPYWSIRHSLTAYDDLVFYGPRLVIPNACRAEVVQDLHSGHQGVTKTLQRAKSSVFWPGLRRRIEEKCLSCTSCLSQEKEGRKEPLISVPVPEFPFEVIGIDPFELNGHSYVAVVDYLTKWPVVRQMDRVRSGSLIGVLEEVFAEYGIPRRIVSDNGPQFTGVVFTSFMAEQGIEHRTSSPLHSSGNGQVERTIGTIKAMMRKCLDGDGKWWEGLMAIRNTPVGDDILSPAQLLQGRLLRDKLPRTNEAYCVSGYSLPEIRQRLEQRQSKQKFYHDDHSGVEKSLLVSGDSVYFKTAKGAWIPGKISRVVGLRSYDIEVGSQSYRRNRKDIRPCLVPSSQSVARDVIQSAPLVPFPVVLDPSVPNQSSQASVPSNTESIRSPEPPVVVGVPPAVVSAPPVKTRVGRSVGPPKWHKDYVMS